MANGKAIRVQTHLVWVPEGGVAYLSDAPAGFVIREIPPDALHDPSLGDVEVLVSPPMRTAMVQPLWGRMRSLRLVQTLSAGVESLLVDLPPGVILCSARGAHDGAVAEWVVGAILAAQKRFPEAWRNQQAERWERRRVRMLQDSTVLLLGYGSIARAVERRLEPFGPRILRVARRARPGVHTWAELAELLSEADVVVVLLPVTPETRGALDAGFLSLLREGTLLVNAARGSLIDTGALLAALEEGRVRAVLDVTEPEPLPPGHPLWRAPSVMITPHVAGLSEQWELGAYRLVRDQLERWGAGEPLQNVVTEAGY